MSLAENLATPGLAAHRDERSGYLFSPLLDFLLLGGGSLVAMAALLLFVPNSAAAWLAWFTIVLSNFINHPHFAFSYQIFYRDFRHKAFGSHYSTGLRTRYIIAGILVPAALIAYFALSMALGLHRAVGFGLNIMAFFVGWHYVKQGYGMLMLDSAIKKLFFSDDEKKAFLVNSYATWLCAWLLANRFISETSLWDLKSYSFAPPDWLVRVCGFFAIATFCYLALVLFKRMREGRDIPWNGLIAYLASVYPWLLARHISPLVFLIVPAMHSLQYIAVVWRYQLNRERAEAVMAGAEPVKLVSDVKIPRGEFRFALFLTTGGVLGALGFWAIPVALDFVVPYDKAALGGSAILAIVWTFINIHHYFLDNVMWRRENADMKKYLFG